MDLAFTWKAIPMTSRLGAEFEAFHTDEHAWRPIPSPFKHLFENRYGLPIVRRYLTYGELLKEIRMEQVLEVAYFTEEKFEDEVSFQCSHQGSCVQVHGHGNLEKWHQAASQRASVGGTSSQPSVLCVYSRSTASSAVCWHCCRRL